MTERIEDRQAEPLKRAPLATRADPPRPKRLSRKAIVAICATALVSMAAALSYSLGDSRNVGPPPEAVSVDRRPSRLLEEGPNDYSELARRVSGDIGAPPAAAGADSLAEPGANAMASKPTGGADPAEEQRRQQAESARSSRLFASAGALARGPVGPGASAAPSDPSANHSPGGAAGQAGRTSQVLAAAREPTVNSGRVRPPAGEHVIMAGSTIPAALITGLSSDLPGQVVAQVTEDVFDSRTGKTRLIPQGARLLGSYDENLGFGQSRALVVWTRLIFPDGRSLDLDRLIGTDAAGQSGLTDRVDHHWGAMLKAGLLSTLLGLGAAVTELGEDGQIANAIRDSAGQTIGRAGDRIVEKQLGVKPTVTVRPGARVRVLVSRDLVLDPWPAE